MAMLGTLLLALLVSAPAEVTGTWAGKIVLRGEDGSKEDTALLILKQKDTTITGTVGGHESNQHPIVSGRIDGSKVTIVARTDSGNEFRLELTVRDDTMTGTVTSDGNRGELHLKKRK